MLTTRGRRLLTAWLFLLGVMVGAAWGQESAPYTITNENPLVIDRADDAPVGLAGFLERIGDSRARTNGTRDGFDFRCAADHGQGWTGLVYRVGDEPTMRAAIELPGGHLGEPEEYADSPWGWSTVQVFDGPIAVTSESIGADPECVRPEGVSLVSRAVAGVGGAGPQPNQSYLVKQMQRVLASCLANFYYEIGGGAVGAFGSGPNYDPSLTKTPNDWRIGDQIWHYDCPYCGSLKFTNARWDPDASSLQYGPTRVAHRVQEDNNDKTKLIQNASDALVRVSYSETESLTNSYTMNVTKGMTMDMSVDATEEVGGSYAGVEAKLSVTEHFGISETSEQSQEKSNEGTHEESLSIEFDAEPGQYYLVTVSKQQETTTQDFAIHGVMDFGLELHWGVTEGWQSARRPPGNSVSLESIAEFDQFVHGYDTDYPTMQGFWEHAKPSTHYGIYCLTEPEHGHRTLSVSGTNTNTLQSNADYRVESLGSSVPDTYKHLPVEDADDVGPQ